MTRNPGRPSAPPRRRQSSRCRRCAAGPWVHQTNTCQREPCHRHRCRSIRRRRCPPGSSAVQTRATRDSQSSPQRWPTRAMAGKNPPPNQGHAPRRFREHPQRADKSKVRRMDSLESVEAPTVTQQAHEMAKFLHDQIARRKRNRTPTAGTIGPKTFWGRFPPMHVMRGRRPPIRHGCGNDSTRPRGRGDGSTRGRTTGTRPDGRQAPHRCRHAPPR
jgi:hypothetical protein